jgi:hypothetical protein
MNAAWYEKQGPARDVLVIGKMPAELGSQMVDGPAESW